MQYQISELRPIDIQVGGVIQDAYQNYNLDVAYSDGFNSFLTKDKVQRAYRGRYEDPVEFLKALRSNQEQVVKNGNITLNQAVLPAIYYYRNLNYSLTSRSEAANNRGVTINQDKLDGMDLDLSYRIVFIAYDTRTLDLLVTAFMLYINSPTRISSNASDGNSADKCACSNITNKGFDVEYSFGPLPIGFNNKSDLHATHIPVSADEGRIYAAEIGDFNISAPVIRTTGGFDVVSTPDVIVITNENSMTHG